MQIHSHKQEDIKKICYADKNTAKMFQKKLFEDLHKEKLLNFFAMTVQQFYHI